MDVKCPSCGFDRSSDDSQYGLYAFPTKEYLEFVLASQDTAFVGMAMLSAQSAELKPGWWYACVGNCGAVGQLELIAGMAQYGMDDNAELHPWDKPDGSESVVAQEPRHLHP